MLKCILVGLNGSQFSRAAGELAILWGQRYQASVTAMGIVDVPHLTAAQPVPLGAGAFKAERDEMLVKEADERISQVLAEFETRCAAADMPCRTIKLVGDPEKLLVREAARADLLIVGKKSVHNEPGSGASRVLVQVLRHATRPVLCVPESVNHAAPVLVAYDGSPPSTKALQAFQELGLAEGRPLHLLTVAGEGHDRHVEECAAEYLQAHGHQPQIHLDTSRRAPATAILAQAKELGAGLIVMGAYGKPLVREFLFGSVTSAVLRDSTVPVFLYH